MWCVPLLKVLLPILLNQAQVGGFPKVDFKAAFGEAQGCFVLREIGADWTLRYNEAGCAERHAPCSTFKVFNALAGLETGVLKDENTTCKWDGKPKWSKAWEHDHNLATALRDSVLWYFQKVAEGIGPERMKTWLDKVGYGNGAMSKDQTLFWLDDSLRISADEQVRFIERLYTDDLPFAKAHQALVRKLLVRDSGPNWTFSGKTGSQMHQNKYVLGWFVGHVRVGERQFVFCTRMTGADKVNGPRAQDVSRRVLADLGIIPVPTAKDSVKK